MAFSEAEAAVLDEGPSDSQIIGDSVGAVMGVPHKVPMTAELVFKDVFGEATLAGCFALANQCLHLSMRGAALTLGKSLMQAQ